MKNSAGIEPVDSWRGLRGLLPEFLSRDPAVAMTGEPYGYANDNPLNGTDPTGLFDASDVLNGFSTALGATGEYLASPHGRAQILNTLGLAAGAAARGGLHDAMELFGAALRGCSKLLGVAGIAAGSGPAGVGDNNDHPELPGPQRVAHAAATAAGAGGGAIGGAIAGAAVCSELAPGAILCATIGGFTGSAGGVWVAHHFTDNNTFIPPDSSNCHDWDPATHRAGEWNGNSFTAC
jgi:hypothetical protein